VEASVLWDDFAKYVYLPRLRDQEVLMATVEAGPASTTWQTEGFAVAVGVDEKSGRYLGLIAGSHPGHLAPTALLVRPEFAIGQEEADEQDTETAAQPRPVTGPEPDGQIGHRAAPSVFRGSIALDPNRPVMQFGVLGNEVLNHLASQVGIEIEIRVEIVARKVDGFPEQVVRTVTENARTLKFDDGSGFSEE
jgi:hypothetical protein